MKIYFTISDLDDNPEYLNLLRVACKSLRENTSCDLACIYNGAESDLTYKILREYKAEIIIREFTKKDALLRIYNDNYMMKNWGRIIQQKKIVSAFMRFEIPFVETTEYYVLYTDIDCIFARDIQLSDFPNLPKYIAAAPEDDKNNYKSFNAGVLLMNVRNCREKFQEIFDKIEHGQTCGGLLDQGYLNWTFKDNYTHLPLEYNWKPYWGINNAAAIIHLHGMKPLASIHNSGFAMHESFFLQVFSKNAGGSKGHLHYTNMFLDILGGNHKKWKYEHAEFLCNLLADNLLADNKTIPTRKYRKYKKLFNIMLAICILLAFFILAK